MKLVTTLMTVMFISLTACDRKSPEKELNEQRMEANKDYREDVQESKKELKKDEIDTSEQRMEDKEEFREDVNEASRERSKEINKAKKDYVEEVNE